MTPVLHQPYLWSLNAQALLLYVLAAVILLAVLAANLSVAAGLASFLKDRRSSALAAAGGMALTSNFVGVATIALLVKELHEPARLSMLFIPLALVAERYLRLSSREPKRRPVHLAALLGSVAGMVGGARLLLLRGVVQSDPIRHVIVPGDVVTEPLAQVLRHPDDWAVSVQLIVLYLASVAIFFGIHAFLKWASRSMSAGLRAGRSRETAMAAVAALALNFAGVAALRFLAQAAGVQPRLALVGLALFLIVESYVLLLRTEPENRRAHWTGLIGSASGIAAATLLLMRDAPLR